KKRGAGRREDDLRVSGLIEKVVENRLSQARVTKRSGYGGLPVVLIHERHCWLRRGGGAGGGQGGGVAEGPKGGSVGPGSGADASTPGPRCQSVFVCSMTVVFCCADIILLGTLAHAWLIQLFLAIFVVLGLSGE